MPIIKIELTAKKTSEEKKDLIDFITHTICSNSGTPEKNIYVFITEWERDNVRQTAPIALIDWTDMPETRTPEAKKAIMVALTDKLQALTGENKDEIVIIFTDIPLINASMGGVTRKEDRNK